MQKKVKKQKTFEKKSETVSLRIFPSLLNRLKEISKKTHNSRVQTLIHDVLEDYADSKEKR